MPRKRNAAPHRQQAAARHRKKSQSRIDAEAARELLAQNHPEEWPIERNDDLDIDLQWRIQMKLMSLKHPDPAENERRQQRGMRMAELHALLCQFPEDTRAAAERDQLFEEICDEAVAQQKADGLIFGKPANATPQPEADDDTSTGTEASEAEDES